jgi:O-antigen ligase
VLRVAGLAGGVVAAGIVVAGLGWGWAAFQASGGIAELRSGIPSEQQKAGSEGLDEDLTQRYATLNTSGRILLWQIAWESWQRQPLTGTGGDTYRIVYQQEKAEDAQEVLHPHSIWMTLLSDKGIFAFLAFAAFSVGVLALAAYNALFKKRSVRSQAIIAGSAAAVTAYLVSTSIDWNWYIPAATIPFFALAAVAAGMTRRKRRKSAGALSQNSQPPA